MRVLVQVSTEPSDTLAPLAARLETMLRGAGVAVEVSPELLPDLEGIALVHLLATGPSERAVRQFLHARRWGCPVVVSGLVRGDAATTDDPARRYEAGLWELIWRGADGIVELAVAGAEQESAGGSGRAAATVILDDPAAGRVLREVYAAIGEGRAGMGGEGTRAEAGQWLPGIAPEEYGRHLEDLCQLQLELIAYRDAEYEALRRQFAEAGEGDEAGLRALKGEYERLGEWSRDVAARHEALQADYARLRRWAGELEGQLRAAQAGGMRERVARWFGRG